MKRIFGNGSYANVTATLALVIALGGHELRGDQAAQEQRHARSRSRTARC